MSLESGTLPATTHGEALRDLLDLAGRLCQDPATLAPSLTIRQAVVALRLPDVPLSTDGVWTAE